MSWISIDRLNDLLTAKPSKGPVTRGEFMELVTRYKGAHPDLFMEEVDTRSVEDRVHAMECDDMDCTRCSAYLESLSRR